MDSKTDRSGTTSDHRNKYIPIRKPHNKRFIIPGLLLIIVLNPLPIQAQEISYALVSDYNEHFNQAIGLDENLINGYKYIVEHPNRKGHPFLGSDEFKPGKLVINNTIYAHVDLLYDILNQDVLLSYKNSLGNVNYIVLHKGFITEFDIVDKHFKKLFFDETGSQFFQVVSNKQIMCLYFWEKTLVVSSSSLKSYYDYSDQNKKTFLVINDTLEQYKGKHSFVKLFPKELQGKIKKYINSRKINLRNASDGSIKKLIEFCESLKPEGNRI